MSLVQAHVQLVIARDPLTVQIVSILDVRSQT